MGVLVDLGLVSFAIKANTKFLFTLERNMNKLFETRAKADDIPDEPNALIQFHDRSSLHCLSRNQSYSNF